MAELNNLVLVVDLDKTICTKKQSDETYLDVKPIESIVEALNTLHHSGAEIVIESARNMLTQHNNESKVIKNVGLDTLNWLNMHGVSYDGIKFGKTMGSCYIDDKALRPKEFMKIFNSLDNKTDIDELNRKITKYLEEN